MIIKNVRSIMVDLTMIHLSNHLNAHFITFVYNFFLNVSHQSTT